MSHDAKLIVASVAFILMLLWGGTGCCYVTANSKVNGQEFNERHAFVVLLWPVFYLSFKAYDALLYTLERVFR